MAIPSKSNKSIDYREALHSISQAITFHAYVNLEGIKIMANNFDALSAAVDNVAAGVAAVAAAIANPATDLNDQAVIDDLAARLNGAVEALAAAKSAEDAEDGATPEPTP